MNSLGKINSKFKWILIVIITFLAVYLSFQYILPLIFPFLIAYFLAWIIRPLTNFMQKHLRLPRIIGSTISMVIITAIIIIALFFLFNTLLKQGIALLRSVPVYLTVLAEQLDKFCTSCDEIFGLTMGTARGVVDDHMFRVVNKVKTEVLPGITRQTLWITIRIIGGIGVVMIIFVSSVLIAKDFPEFKKTIRKQPFYKDISIVSEKLSDVGMGYLKAQLIIMAIVAGVCVLGLTLIGNKYALILGIGIALMDALPVFGSGIVFIPWGIIMLFSGNIYAAAILFTSYVLCLITREVMEPKLIGNHIGIKPLFTLMSMFIGFKLFSIAGFILGPIGLVIIITVVKTYYEKAKQIRQ